MNPETQARVQRTLADLAARNPAHEVRISTVFAHGVGATPEVATADARGRLDHLSRGHRVAHVHRDGKETESFIVTRDQAATLVRAGARPAAIDVEEAEVEAVANESASAD